MTQLNFGRDVQGMNAYAVDVPTDNFSATMTTGSVETVVVPSTSTNWIAKISCAAPVWVSVAGTAAKPVGATFAATTSFLVTPNLIGSTIKVQGGQTISIFNNNTGSQDVGVALFALAS